jgi:tight adherence protein B
MDNGLLIFVVAFAVLAAGLIWAGLHFGGRWFRNRQTREASAAAQALEGMFIFTGTQRLHTVSLIVTILLPVVAWFLTGNLFIVGICVVLAFVSPKWVVRFIAKRRLNQFEQQLPDSLLMITGALRAGASLPIALESVASEGKPPISQEFELLLRELRLGVDFAVALRNLEKRVPLSDLAMVTAGMALSREVGANLAETLDSIAKTIRAKLQMEGKIKSLTAQGKMQGLVMAGLPVFLILVLRFMEPEAMEPMFTTWYGWATVAVITVADMIGYFFIRKITAIDV